VALNHFVDKHPSFFWMTLRQIPLRTHRNICIQKTCGFAKIRALKVERMKTVQRSFSNLEYAAKPKVTRGDRLLGEIDAAAP
jgi:hypothetical protein